MRKAVREAKLQTNWQEPDADYEEALSSYISAAIENENFVSALAEFVELLAPVGCWNSLVARVLQLIAPGIPNIYQGDEFWNFSLVDPDNRAAVDFRKSRELLAGAVSADEQPGEGRQAINSLNPGSKPRVISRLLKLRQSRAEFFRDADYEPLYAEGPGEGRLLCFRRRKGAEQLVVVAARLFSQAVNADGSFSSAVFHGSHIAHDCFRACQNWTEQLSGRSIKLGSGRAEPGELLSEAPFAVLTPD